MKKIVVLGSSGSIGENTLRIVQALPSEFEITALSVRTNYQRALEQAQEFNVKHVAVADPDAAKECRSCAPGDITVHEGIEGLEEISALDNVDIVVCAVVGMAGLRPVMSAVSRGTNVALATKEVLVAAGDIVTRTCTETGAKILPVDSEHSALFQCVGNTPAGEIKRMILTASGGPFSSKPDVDLDKVTVEEALNHPRWNMGKKVTIDSATLMNKGLEVIEAHWLFDMPIDNIDVIIHPESIIHSIVEFIDGNMMAHMSPTDMRYAIQYALTWPNRMDGKLESLDLAKLGSLNFMPPDSKRFPCLDLARSAGLTGGTLPTVMNAANEIAVEKFLAGTMHFSEIWKIVETTMEKHDVITGPDMVQVIDADSWARQTALNINV